MPKTHPIQNRFTGGELSPRFLASSDLEIYTHGAQQLENFIPYLHGSMNRRPGTQFRVTVPGTEGRLLGFQRDPTEAYPVTLSSDGNIRVHNPTTGVAVFTAAHNIPVAQLAEVQFEQPPRVNELWLTAPGAAPKKLTYTDPTTWAYADISFTAPPSVWTGSNFPRAVTFFQGRSFWGGTPNEPETFWASKSGALTDLTTGTEPDSGLEFTIERRGAIAWMEGVKNLLIGTVNDEFIVTAAEGVVAPGDIQVERQSANGSRPVQATPIGNQVLYISTDGAKLRDVDYKWTEEAWVSRDLSFPAEHFKDLGKMDELHYSKNPESIVWAVTDNGLLFGCTYDKLNNVVAWHRHPTQGEYKSAITLEDNGTTRLWVLVNRNNTLELELMDNFTTPHEHLDSYVRGTNSPASNQVSAPHLPNQEVSVLIRLEGAQDFAVHPDIVLDGSGNGTLQVDVVEWIVGLSYKSEFISMPIDPVGFPGGATQPLEKRWNRIFVRLLDSEFPLINGTRPPTREPSTPMGEPQPGKTGDAEVRDEGGWDTQITVTVVQDLPVECFVLGIFGEFSGEGL